MLSNFLLLAAVPASTFAAAVSGSGSASAQSPNPSTAPWTSPLTVPQAGYTNEQISAPLNQQFIGSWADARAAAVNLVGQMTLAEKANLTGGITQNIARCEGSTGAVLRLGIKELCFQDGPLGIRPTDGNSVFPAGITVAATFDSDLMYQRGLALGQEFRGKGINVWLAPVTGGPLGRTAYGGRFWEGFGADPYLTGVASYQTVAGAQAAGVIATSKHFIGYEQETFRSLQSAASPFTLATYNNTNTISSNIDDRTLHELYLPGFAEAVRAGVGSVMISYNRVNGTQAAQNSKIINGILKTELDYPGVVISDWYATYDGVASALSGLDVEMPNSDFMGPQLIPAVQNGSLSEARLDDQATRLLTAWFKMGQNKGYPAVNYHGNTLDTYFNGTLVNEHVDVKGNHSVLIKKIATDGIVLLKNENNALPLQYGVGRIGVFGSDAQDISTGPNSCMSWIPGSYLCAADSTNNGTNYIGWGSGAARFSFSVDPISAMQNEVETNGGFLNYAATDTDYAAINATVAISDSCVVFTQARSGEDSDRLDLSLQDQGDALVQLVASQCNNTIVVMHTVGPVIIESWADHPNVTAIVNANLPGQDAGNPIVDILFGKANPSGKLPYSWPKTDVYPPIYSDAVADPFVNFDEKLLIDYRYLDANNITPRYEYGYGLSYTNFTMSGMKLSQTSGSYSPSNVTARAGAKNAPGGDPALYEYVFQVDAQVKNNGKMAGAEVAQVYVAYPTSAGEPPNQLRGFQKVMVSQGGSTPVSIKIRRKDLSIWDVVAQKWTVPQGTYTFHLGTSSRKFVASSMAAYDGMKWTIM